MNNYAYIGNQRYSLPKEQVEQILETQKPMKKPHIGDIFLLDIDTNDPTIKKYCGKYILISYSPRLVSLINMENCDICWNHNIIVTSEICLKWTDIDKIFCKKIKGCNATYCAKHPDTIINYDSFKYLPEANEKKEQL